MTLEEKRELLLKDLCGRLPYGVNVKDDFGDIIHVNIHDAHIEHLILRISYGIDKMLLRPLSSMTEEEFKELDTLERKSLDYCLMNEVNGYTVESIACDACVVDFCNKHHLDYRGLIPMGLAVEGSEGMY
jgi:hypothetical protein